MPRTLYCWTTTCCDRTPGVASTRPATMACPRSLSGTATMAIGTRRMAPRTRRIRSLYIAVPRHTRAIIDDFWSNNPTNNGKDYREGTEPGPTAESAGRRRCGPARHLGLLLRQLGKEKEGAGPGRVADSSGRWSDSAATVG